MLKININGPWQMLLFSLLLPFSDVDGCSEILTFTHFQISLHIHPSFISSTTHMLSIIANIGSKHTKHTVLCLHVKYVTSVLKGQDFVLRTRWSTSYAHVKTWPKYFSLDEKVKCGEGIGLQLAGWLSSSVSSCSSSYSVLREEKENTRPSTYLCEDWRGKKKQK